MTREHRVVQPRSHLAQPNGPAPGVYYVGAIADVNGAVAEGNEGNNTRMATGTITVTP
ncbi:MAG: hypothetical protein HY203_10680 [Nitrospirae bacterium]|nr:hypothetical protein [Nitrospirota bacterium]